MTNYDRQKALEKQRIKRYDDITACGHDDYCDFCDVNEMDDDCCCAKAYNRMIRARASEKPKKAKEPGGILF